MLPNCNRGRRRLGDLRLAKPGLGYFAGVPPGTPNLASRNARNDYLSSIGLPTLGRSQSS